jgi:hypothetical protein
MRTTLTIDDDLAAELERLRRSRNIRFKALVNDTLRRGLRQVESPKKKSRRQPFTKPVDLGQPLIDNVDCIGELLARLEGELYR